MYVCMGALSGMICLQAHIKRKDHTLWPSCGSKQQRKTFKNQELNVTTVSQNYSCNLWPECSQGNMHNVLRLSRWCVLNVSEWYEVWEVKLRREKKGSRKSWGHLWCVSIKLSILFCAVNLELVFFVTANCSMVDCRVCSSILSSHSNSF